MTTPASNGSRKTLAILSIVFGAISILFAWIFPIFWVLLAIASIILGFVSRRREPAAKNLAITGIILGFVGLLANIGSMVAGAIIVASYMQQM